MAHRLVEGRSLAFENGIDLLIASFETATQAIAGEVWRAEADLTDDQRERANGGTDDAERDEDGNPVWSRAIALENEAEMGRAAALAVRKAFCIALYHHWERSAYQWIAGNAVPMNDKKPSHTEIVDSLRFIGVRVSRRIDIARYLANTLKHSNSTWGNRLYRKWPALFRDDFSDHENTDWYEAIILTDSDVREIAAIVRTAGLPFGTSRSAR